MICREWTYDRSTSVYDRFLSWLRYNRITTNLALSLETNFVISQSALLVFEEKKENYTQIFPGKSLMTNCINLFRNTAHLVDSSKVNEKKAWIKKRNRFGFISRFADFTNIRMV